MSKAKYTKDTIDQTIRLFVRESEKEHNSYAFACGIFAALLVPAIADMPLHKQTEIMQLLHQLTNKNVEI